MCHELQFPRWATYLAMVALLAAVGCGGTTVAPPPEEQEEDPLAGLRDALLIHAGFDNGPDASFAKGDAKLYTAPSYKELDKAVPGLSNPEAEIVAGAGRFGDALKFNKKNEHAVFYRAQDNVAYSPTGWNGTVSFWLSLDPAVDLAPGFCDPIQLTDAAYNDGAVWVDFTQQNPRQFRLGVFGDFTAWNPDKLPQDKNPIFDSRVIVVESPPFARGKWTHIAIAHEGLGSPQGGTARLYVDGNLMGEKMIPEPFTIDPANMTIRLGVNYVGLWDELAVFNRPLTEQEIQRLGALTNGVRDLHQ